VVYYSSAFIEDSWLIKDKARVGRNDNWNRTLLQDGRKSIAIALDYFAFFNIEMWHCIRVVLALLGLLFVDIIGLKSYSEVQNVQVCIIHHSSIAANVAIWIAAVDELLFWKINGIAVCESVVRLKISCCCKCPTSPTLPLIFDWASKSLSPIDALYNYIWIFLYGCGNIWSGARLIGSLGGLDMYVIKLSNIESKIEFFDLVDAEVWKLIMGSKKGSTMILIDLFDGLIVLLPI
jgi:hypothetical protein